MSARKKPGKIFGMGMFDMGSIRIASLGDVAEALAVAEGEGFR